MILLPFLVILINNIKRNRITIEEAKLSQKILINT